jgi:hypothetical protein
LTAGANHLVYGSACATTRAVNLFTIVTARIDSGNALTSRIFEPGSSTTMFSIPNGQIICLNGQPNEE